MKRELEAARSRGLSRSCCVVLAASVAATTFGCKVYDPSLLHRDAGNPGSCEARRPPRRPTIADGASGPNRFFALKDIVLDQRSDRWRSIGYDLDRLCSVAPTPMVECVPSHRGVTPETDGDNGIDNAFGHDLSPVIVLAEPTLADDAVMNQLLGLGAVLVDIREWNGQDEDPRVDVVISQSVFGTPGSPDGGVPMPMVPDGGVDYVGGHPPLPRWDGNDYWWSRDDDYASGDPTRPLIRDDNAYITGRTLVMVLPDRSDITFSGDMHGVDIRLTDAHLTGVISADNTSIAHVTVAGRWSTDDLLAVVENIGVCRGTVQYNLLTNLLADSADVRSAPGTGGPDVPCNALSFGVELTGYAAHWGGVAHGLPLPDTCGALDAGM